MINTTPRTQTDFNKNWQFQLCPIGAPKKESWTNITLPHDWSIEKEFDSKWDGATGYLPGGIGWYRKSFANPTTEIKQRAYIVFDGIYNHAKVYVNDNHIITQTSGYAPFYIDITDFLQASNEIVIEVDRSRYVDSRWYSGSGIYRHVQLITTHSTHIGIWGESITTQKIEKDAVVLNHSLEIHSSYKSYPQTIEAKIAYRLQNLDTSVCFVSKKVTLNTTLQKISIESVMNAPILWSVDTPSLYVANVNLYHQESHIDNHQTRFGIRSFNFDSENGFSLNGERMKIKGVCLHHDGGLVGAAVPKQVWLRRLLKLKECGVNAIRIAHNPASNEFLDLCDELGFLVQDEFFDEWDYPKDKRLNMADQHKDTISEGYSSVFQTDAKKDLIATVKSHRNHPCIFMWSIGNEIEWCYPRNAEATGFFDAKWDGNYFWSLPPNTPAEIAQNLKELPQHEYDIGETAQKLSNWVKLEDTSRPITANCILPSSSYLSGYADALDVIGFSYRRVIYDYGHKLYPNIPIIGNENLPQWHEWKDVLEKPHVSGLFLWTGINYMGESHNKWPIRTTDSGLLDCAGFTRSPFYMFQSLWSEHPVINIVTQAAKLTDLIIDKDKQEACETDPTSWKSKLWTWPDRNEHWNYDENEQEPNWVVVEVFTNCEEVELFINDKLISGKKLIEQQDHILRWAVPFQTGQLKAVGKKQSLVTKGEIEHCNAVLNSSSEPVKLTLEVEGSSEHGPIRHITIQAVDKQNNPIRHSEFSCKIDVHGARLLGVDNGSASNTQPHKSNIIQTFKGKALAIIELDDAVQEHTLQVDSKEICSQPLRISIN